MAYIDNFNSTSLDYCGFHAIEVFEETKGNQYGTSMGDNYMEGKYKEFDKTIMGRIDNTIGRNVWNKFSPKFKMQLWSFMFNSDSDIVDRYRWLAVLANTVNYDNLEGFDEAYTLEIIGKKGSLEWGQALSDIINSNSFNYENLISCLDGQYATFGNKTAYENSWKYRPSDLDTLYNECSNKPAANQQQQQQQQSQPESQPETQKKPNNILKIAGAGLILTFIIILVTRKKSMSKNF